MCKSQLRESCVSGIYLYLLVNYSSSRQGNHRGQSSTIIVYYKTFYCKESSFLASRTLLVASPADLLEDVVPADVFDVLLYH